MQKGAVLPGKMQKSGVKLTMLKALAALVKNIRIVVEEINSIK